MTRRRLNLVSVNTGRTTGAVVIDDGSGALTFEDGAVAALARDREKFGGTDADYGRMLLAQGWSNGHLYLAEASS